MDWSSIVSGVGSILGSVVSGIFGSEAQAGANEKNVQIAQENREWQTGENQINRQWAEKMWQVQNQYNTPSAMMQRYREAGLNPYLVQKDGASGIGQADSPNSPSMVSAPNQASVLAVNPLQGLGNLGSAIGLGLESRNVNAHVANQHADAVLKISQALPELGKTLGWDNARMVALNELNLVGIKGSQYESMIDEQINSYRLNNQFQSIQNKIADKYGDRKAALECDSLEQGIVYSVAEIGKMSSDTKLNESNIQVNKAKIRELASEFVKNHKEALYYAAQTNTLDQLRQYVVSSARSSAQVSGYAARTAQSKYIGASGVRDYLESGDAINSIRDAYILSVERNADEFWSLVMQLGNFNVGASVHN